jgi:probable F420-dependent oxidoreductase
MSATAVVERIRRRLGAVGVYGVGASTLAGVPVARERDFGATVERLGYGSLWIGEGIGGKDVFARQGVALAETARLAMGTGIANVWARHPRTMHAAAATLAEAYPDRFVLGVGIGHAGQAAKVGEEYRPMRRMREYLDQMDAPVADGYAETGSPAAPFARVLAAVGPNMLALAAERADGAHPFVQPVELTARARQVLGPDKLLIPQQSVLLTNDREEGLEIAAAMLRMVRQMPAYAANYRRLGFTDEEIAEPSRRLVDAVFAVGDEDRIADRVREHLAAGADHVLVSPITDSLAEATAQLTALAPALVGV